MWKRTRPMAVFVALSLTTSLGAINFQEDSYFFYLDLTASPNWTCSATINMAGRCFNDNGLETAGNRYGPNGLKIVQHGGTYYHYLQLQHRSDGPASQYDEASFVVLTSGVGWHQQRGGNQKGTSLQLVNDNVRPADTREWTLNHAFHDGSHFRIFAAHVENGGNDTYTTSRIAMATTADGVSFGDNFEAWEDVLWARRDHGLIRLLAILVLPDPANPGKLAGVLTWLDHNPGPGEGPNGTTPIRIDPSNKTFDLFLSNKTWAENLPFGTQITPALRPDRTISGRTMAFSHVDQGGSQEYVIWRGVPGPQRNPNGIGQWIPCPGGIKTPDYIWNVEAAVDPTDPNDHERFHWGPNPGTKVLQYRTFDMTQLETQQSNPWVDYTSQLRSLKGDYPMFGGWIIDVVDFGQHVMVYWASRDSHVCNYRNEWDKGVGRAIYWSHATVTP
ncbi:MAG: hypothetical protein MI919_40055 [Holophagales bacterium]|nr:hypothetical protein [Holophagales bacterium]